MDLAGSIPDAALLDALHSDTVTTDPQTLLAQLTNLRAFIRLGERRGILGFPNADQTLVSIEQARAILMADWSELRISSTYESVEPTVRHLSEQRLRKQLNHLVERGLLSARAARKEKPGA